MQTKIKVMLVNKYVMTMEQIEKIHSNHLLISLLTHALLVTHTLQ